MTTTEIGASAAGALAAQRAIAELRSANLDSDVLWLRLVEVTAEFGWKSAGVPAFVREVAKAIRS